MASIDPMRSFEGIRAQTSYNKNGKEHSNCVAESLDRLGHKLTSPASWWLDGFVRVFVLPLEAKWWGQKSCTFSEVGYRACLTVLGIATLPFAILGTILGAPLRAITSCSKKDFVWLKKAADPIEEKEVGEKTTGRILSFNALMMPEFISRRNLHRSTMERAHEVAQVLIDALNGTDDEEGCDIACLQEVFHTGAAKLIADKVHKATGCEVLYNVRPNMKGLNSGLMTLSKRKLENVQFFEHPFSDGADTHAKKGILIATTKIGNKTVIVGNYHANGGGDKIPGYVCRAAQQIAATAQMKMYRERAEKAGTKIDDHFLVGDTNVGPTDYSCERDERTGLLKPQKEYEWLLADRLQVALEKPDVNALAIPDAKHIKNKKMWGEFIRRVKRFFGEVVGAENEKNRSLDAFLKDSIATKSGGPFASTLYRNDLHRDDATPEKAMRGTTVDMRHSPQVGHGRGATAAQPQRVDFVSLGIVQGRPEEEYPDMRAQVVPMSAHGKPICSDHHAVISTVTWTNAV